MSVQTKEKGPYFLDQPYEVGRVFRHLVSMQFDIVVGLDFGHGESVAYKNYKDNGDWAVKRLQMNFQDDATIPTYLSYIDGEPKIGGDLTYALNFVQHFKEEPWRWNVQGPGGRTFGEMIRDYISVMWRSILQFDETVAKAQKDGRLLIAVGCPASPQWTSQKSLDAYTHLVAQATGCENVTILPESTAAIMTPIFSSRQERVDGGIIIYDLGSSTIDFTYVHMGKILISRSLRLGGSNIDRSMLRQALANSGMNETILPREQRNSILAQLRNAKEKYFRSGTSLPPATIALLQTDEDGVAIPNKWQKQGLNYIVDDESMRRVLREDRLMNVDNPDYQGLSWAECCEKFYRETKSLIGNRPYTSVVLTGGTSFVTEAQALCKACYGKELVTQDPNPSASVARGLCYAKGLESRTYDKIDEARIQMQPVFDKAYNLFITELAQTIFDHSWDVSGQVTAELAQDGQKHKLSEIADEVENRIDGDTAFLTKLETKFQQSFVAQAASCQEDIRKSVNKLSAELYGANLSTPPQLPGISAKAQSILASIDLEELVKGIDPLSGIKTILDRLTLGAILLSLALSALGDPTSIVTVIGSIISLISSGSFAAAYAVLNKKTLGHLQLKNLAAQYGKAKEKERNLKKALPDMQKAFNTQETIRAAFDTLLNQQFEVAIGMILFLVYAEKTDS